MKKTLLLTLLLAVAGCTTVSVQKYKDIAFTPTNPSEIVIYPDKPKTNNFIELGEITVNGAGDWGEVEKIFRKKAAQMGADAVYVFSKKEDTQQYLSPDDCDAREGDYFPYHHFGWIHYGPGYYYPRGYYYCYPYRPSLDTATFITAVGIAIKYQ